MHYCFFWATSTPVKSQLHESFRSLLQKNTVTCKKMLHSFSWRKFVQKSFPIILFSARQLQVFLYLMLFNTVYCSSKQNLQLV